jgi:hypothetical protein
MPNQNSKKTHCKRGHEFSPENTWIDKKDYRHCMRCHADRMYLRHEPKRRRYGRYKYGEETNA